MVKFDICQETGCSLTITGNSDYGNTSNLGQTTYEESITINVLVLNKVKSEKVIQSEVSHICEISIADKTQVMPVSDIDTIKIQEDGHYTIYHIIIPTISQDELVSYTQDLTTQYYWYENGKIYYKDGNDKKEYKGNILELLSTDDNVSNNIRYACKDIFVLCHLQECFINHCKDVFSSLYTFQCSKKSSKVDTFNRDLLWMTINVIKYYIENGQYSAAQALLEEFEGCGSTICKQSSSTKLNSNGCGCSR